MSRHETTGHWPLPPMTRADLDRLSAEADGAMRKINRARFRYEVGQAIRSYFAPVTAAWRFIRGR